MSRVTKRLAVLLVMVSVVFTSVAQLLFSIVMKQTNVDPSNLVGVVLLLPFPDHLSLGLGVVLYATSMLAWIVALTRFPISLAYPVLSISYVIVYIAATFLPVLSEPASLEKSLGVVLVAAGISVLFLDERLSDTSELSSTE